MWGSDNYVHQIGYLRIFNTLAQGGYTHVAGKTFTGTYTASTGNFVISSDGITLSVVPRGDDACAVPMCICSEDTQEAQVKGEESCTPR